MLHVSGPIPPAIYCTSLTCCVPVHGRFPPSPGDCCDSGSRNKHTCACARVCGGERESMQATAVGSRSCLSAFFFFSPPGLGAASGSAGQRVLCSPVPEKSSQAEWYRTQPDTELQMDGPTETRRNRIAVVSVHL